MTTWSAMVVLQATTKKQTKNKQKTKKTKKKQYWYERNSHQGFENDGLIFDGKDYVRIIIDFGLGTGNNMNKPWMYEICCQQLTFGEFKAILQEMCNFEMNINVNGQQREDQYVILFSHYCQFFGMNDNDIIPPIQELSNTNNEFDNVYYIQCPTDFITNFGDMHTRKEKKRKCGSSCNIIKTMKSRLQAANDNFLDEYNNNMLKNIENHLLANDHGSLLPFGNCKYGIKCKKFIKLCTNLSKDIDIKDRIHMHFFRHPSHRLVVNNNNNNNNNHNDSNNNIAFFEYIDSSTYNDPIYNELVRFTTIASLNINWLDSNVALLVLMYEVIKNGYEKELTLQKEKNFAVTTRTHFNYVLTMHGILNVIEKIYENKDKSISKILTMDNETAIKKLDSTNWNNLMQELKQEYKILNTLDTKMKHAKHVEIGSPLSIENMFALILWTDTECYSNLVQELRKCKQIDFTFVEKWKYFDYYLYYAILKLSKFEKYNSNIFTGSAGVYLDETKFDDKYSKSILLKTYRSFSRDLGVAEQFRGSDGIIIGVNLQSLRHVPLDSIHDSVDFINQCNQNNVRTLAKKLEFELHGFGFGLLFCDVSWISKFPNEKEVLVAKHSMLPINTKQIYWPQSNQSNESKVKRQYVVCDLCLSGNASFADMFGKYKRFTKT